MFKVVIHENAAYKTGGDIPVKGGTADVLFILPEKLKEYNLIAVFKTAGTVRDVILSADEAGNYKAAIPTALLSVYGYELFCGVYAYKCNKDSGVKTDIIPTIWCSLGIIADGADPDGDDEDYPTASLYQQLEDKKADKEQLILHMQDEGNPHGVTAEQTGAYDKAAVDEKFFEKEFRHIILPEEFDSPAVISVYWAQHQPFPPKIGDMVTIEKQLSGGEDAHKTYMFTYSGFIPLYGEEIEAALSAHEEDTENPHGVTAEQTGAYDKAAVDEKITAVRNEAADRSGEISAALSAHEENTENPHGVTAEQTGAYDKAAVDEKIAAVRSEAANALKAKASGSVIYLDDVSPLANEIKATVTGVSDPTSVTLNVCGKNIIPQPYYGRNGTNEIGVDIKNENGVLTLNGTATVEFSYNFIYKGNLPVDGQYTLSLSQYDENKYAMQLQVDGIPKLNVINTAMTGELYGNITRLALWVKAGAVFENTVIKPQLERGISATEYEPNVLSTFTPDENGEVSGITTLPVMNLYTDSAQAEIAVEYNVDTNSIINYTPPFDYNGYDVPVIEFYGNTGGMSKDNKVTLSYKYGERAGTCTLKWQGSSSLQYPKKNYTVVFDNAFEAVAESAAYHGDKAQIGWGEQKKYCLKADYIDFSHCRNVVSATLWGEMVRTRANAGTLAQLPNGGAIDGFPCFVVINGVWQGIYNFNIPKDKWLFGMSGASEKEAILCGNNASAGNQYNAEAQLGTDFDLEYASDGFTEEEITASLNEIFYTSSAVNSGTKSIDELEQHIDLNSVIDYMIFTVLTGSIDITGKNQILATNDGVKWFMSAYDLDSSFGIYPDGNSILHSGYITGKMFSDVSFAWLANNVGLYKAVYDYKRAELIARYRYLRSYILSVSNVTHLFDSHVKNIPAAAFEAEAELWKGVPSTAASNVQQITQWYADRVSWVDKEIAELEGAEPEYKVYTDSKIGDIYAALTAHNVSYDNSDSGLDADNVKSAIDELTQKMGGVAKIVVESWEDVQRIVRLGLAPKTFAIGDQLICNHATYGELVWDIIGFDHDVPNDDTQTHSMTIQLHSLLSDSLMYDAIEALYYAETELPAGTYNFTLLSGYDTAYGGGKTYYFTITKPVPAGGQIVFDWGYQKQAAECKISTYASQTSTTVIESVGVTEGSEGTALENTNHTHRARSGSGRWSQSAIRQWLNSDGEKSAWWNPSNIYDRPVKYASTNNGFLNGLDADFLAVIGEVTKRNALSPVADGGGYEDTTELMFLISRGEVYGGNENGINEGTPYPYYSENSDLSAAGTGADANRIKSKVGGNAAAYWRLRSCNSSYGNYVRLVNLTGNISSDTASNGYGVAPACNII